MVTTQAKDCEMKTFEEHQKAGFLPLLSLTPYSKEWQTEPMNSSAG